MSDKKVPNNIKGRRPGSGAEMISDQILRWRQKMRKQEIVLGKHSAKAKERNAKLREERAKPDPTKRKFF